MTVRDGCRAPGSGAAKASDSATGFPLSQASDSAKATSDKTSDTMSDLRVDPPGHFMGLRN
jgi:hypothetical protein